MRHMNSVPFCTYVEIGGDGHLTRQALGVRATREALGGGGGHKVAPAPLLRTQNLRNAKA